MSSKLRNFRASSPNGDPPKNDENEIVRIDVARLKLALESGVIKAPRGMSREEKAKFIIKHSK